MNSLHTGSLVTGEVTQTFYCEEPGKSRDIPHHSHYPCRSFWYASV